MLSNYVLIVITLTVVSFISVKAEKLTLPAGIAGWVAGLLIFAGAGYTGLAMIAIFFVLGTGATSWGMSFKQKLGLAEKDKGRRTTRQVIANAGVAMILGTLAVVYSSVAELFRVMIAASFASATADTLSSEMGNLYGKNFYNITTFKKDTRGLDGVISIEGTIIGIFGSIVISTAYALGYGFDLNFFSIIIAGTIGNFSDSVLGATLERKGYLDNNQVNFLNTTIAALSALLFFCFMT